MKKYLIGTIVFILILLLTFGGYYIYSSNQSQHTVESLKRKVDTEIGHLSKTIISMMNQMNHISYENYRVTEDETFLKSKNSNTLENTETSKNKESEGNEKTEDNSIINMNMDYSSILVNPSKKIDWDTIKKETEKMYQTWNTILIDLNSLNVKQDDLLKYTSVLNDLTKAVQKEDKKISLQRLSDLYRLLVMYTKQYSNDNKKIALIEVKSNILSSYVLAEDSNWKGMQDNIKKAQSVYHNLLNSSLQQNEHVAYMNRIYVLLNEIYRSTEAKDKDIFYIHYRNLMQELKILSN